MAATRAELFSTWKQQYTSYFIATDMRKNEKMCLILNIILALLRSKIKAP